jgi:hypothetical protein
VIALEPIRTIRPRRSSTLLAVFAVLAGTLAVTSTRVVASEVPDPPILLPVGASEPAVAAGGRWMAYATSTEIIRRDLLAGTQQTLPRGAFDRNVAFVGRGPDLVVRTATEVFVWRAGTAAATRVGPDAIPVCTATGGAVVPPIVDVVPSPTGTHVAVEIQNLNANCQALFDPLTIVVVDTATATSDVVTRSSLDGVWAFDGNTLVHEFGRYVIGQGIVSSAQQAPPVAPRRTYEDIRTTPSRRVMTVSWFDPNVRPDPFGNRPMSYGIWEPISGALTAPPDLVEYDVAIDVVGGVLVTFADGPIPFGAFDLRRSAFAGSFTNFTVGGQVYTSADARLSADGRFAIVRSVDGRFIVARHPAPLTTFSQITVGSPVVPSGASSVLVNLAMVDGISPGYVTADRCASLPFGPQTKANGNFSTGSAIANLAVVPVDADGTFCVFASNPVHVVADVQGSFGAAPGGLGFVAIGPDRLLDTRTPPAVRPSANSITRVETGVASGTAAVLVNLAMTDGAAAGYITADRCSVLQAGPQSKANGNHLAGSAISNLSVVPVDADGAFCIYTQSAVDLVVDLQGAFRSGTGEGFTSIGPDRLLDTRTAPGAIVPAGSITAVSTGVASGTSAVLVNLAMVDGAAPGYITADRCSVLQAGPQSKANGNHLVGTAVSNLSVVPVDADGRFCIYNQSPVNVVVDLQGAFSPTGALRFTPSATVDRAIDTRFQ